MLAALDTNHFRVVAEGGPAAARIDRRAATEDVEIFLSIITVQEATGGWLGLIIGMKAGRDQVRAYASFQKTILAFPNFGILAFGEVAAEHFHLLRSEHPRIGTMDLKIAAICLAHAATLPRCHAATLLTRNLVDFSGITGLRVENWLD